MPLKRFFLASLLVCLVSFSSFGASLPPEVIEALAQTVQALETTRAELATVLEELSKARIEQENTSNVLRVVQNEQIPLLRKQLNDYEQSSNDRVRNVEIKAYLISAVGILAALLIAVLT